jgi:hypothetical protein
MVYVPVAALVPTVSVSVEEPDPGAAMLEGLKLAVTPVGMPLAERATASSNPPETEEVTVELPLFPCVTLTDAGLAASSKVGDEVKLKHCVKLPVAELPSRGGKGAPLVELLVSGVLVLNEELMEASVGRPNTASMNFNCEA